jgi:transcriptional regulator with XRE-family HTH domain
MSDGAFPDWLKHELLRREWNMSDFARRAGISPSVIGRWVRGERIPDPQSCDLIADTLGVDVDRVLVLAGHRPNLEDLPLTEEQTAIMALVRRVKLHPDRAALLRLMLEEWLRNDRQP